jgi:hypothetical protein
MTWTLKQPLCPKTTLYLPIGLGGGGDHVTKVQYTWTGLVTPPTPSPPKLPTSQTKVIALNWPLRREGWRDGGGEGWFLGRYHSNMLSLEKQSSFRVRPHSYSKSFHGRPNSWTMLYGASEVPGQEKEPVQRVANHVLFKILLDNGHCGEPGGQGNAREMPSCYRYYI